MTTINARRCSFTIGAVLMISIGFVSITTNPYVAIALMSIGGFAHQTLSTVVITMSADLFKKMRSRRLPVWQDLRHGWDS